MPPPIHLEGTTLEGGGQLLRIAIGFSSLSKTAVRITNIRGKRSGGGGLKSQHLTSMQWLSQVSNARLSGAGLKSKEVTYTPTLTRKSKPNSRETQIFEEEYQISQNTPGSINLIFQAVLPYLLFGGAPNPIKIRITGGTNVSNSPSYDYVAQVLIPMLSVIGIGLVTAELHSRGWSQGRVSMGDVTFYVTPLPVASKFPSFTLAERGAIKSVKATVIAPVVCETLFREELDVVMEQREKAIFGDSSPEWQIEFEDSGNDKRFYLLLVATTNNGYKLGRDWLYDHSLKAGKIDTVVSKMVRKVMGDLVDEIEHEGCVDEYMRDQLVVFQALAEGKSQVFGGRRKDGRLVEPSLHTRTAQWVAKKMVDADFDEEGSCVGCGFLILR